MQDEGFTDPITVDFSASMVPYEQARNATYTYISRLCTCTPLLVWRGVGQLDILKFAIGQVETGTSMDSE